MSSIIAWIRPYDKRQILSDYLKLANALNIDHRVKSLPNKGGRLTDHEEAEEKKKIEILHTEISQFFENTRRPWLLVVQTEEIDFQLPAKGLGCKLFEHIPRMR